MTGCFPAGRERRQILRQRSLGKRRFSNYSRVVAPAFRSRLPAKEGTLLFPDGAAIAAIHWTRVPSEDNNKVLDVPFPGTQSFVIGSPVNVQFMVKKSKKYAATGRWGVR